MVLVIPTMILVIAVMSLLYPVRAITKHRKFILIKKTTKGVLFFTSLMGLRFLKF